ncbi:Aurofusarin cluster transcription factor aurR2 [Hyphodiscus hymeniophilus]|uniref:Aurofusarin cluster transcription factor aurR2 n=1 Tax=Hyphodiscus hymeniophilus TaxID=353542 RepID=A0A9P7AX21_9HELO|nr:Aurofusarin cluster transcription factor aurR2 [Hyphodiscus hymeniophilus]
MLTTPPGNSEGLQPLPPAPSSPKITRGHSCILCQQRKVKCDRSKPCSNCIKARTECIPSAPTVPRRRRRKFSEQDIAAKLRRYEHLLKKNGIKIEDDDDDATEDSPQNDNHTMHLLEVPRPPKADKGMLFTDHQNSRYVENTLWENLRDEIQDPKDALQTSSDDESNETSIFPEAGIFYLRLGFPNKDLSSLHPSPVQIFRLWQTYLVNVNPLVKIFHAPTVQQVILDATGDLSKIPRATESLMFAIYLLSVTSLKSEECETMFGETRAALVSKYSQATQQALVNGRFLKSVNLYSLQAFALYLLALRRGYDPQSMWVLTGAAVRISQRLGIHRDGADHQVSPFDAEMRRRTWWQVVSLDGQASKLAGAGFPGWLARFDTKMPLNISDSDLSPSMKEFPVEKEGATEMLFCCLRYEVAEALRKTSCVGEGRLGQSFIKQSSELIVEKDKAIDALEIRFEQKYIRYCDPSIPLHLLAIYMSKSVICTMRMMAHHPRQYPDRGASMPQKEKDMLFSESLKELEIATMGHSNKLVQGFLWHAFIYILSELRHRTTGDQVDRAWQQIETSFEQRPEMLSETKNSLYYAIGNLTLKAWARREEAGGLYQGSHQLAPPRFISVLRSQRNISTPTSSQLNTEWRDPNPVAPSNPMLQYGNNLVLAQAPYDASAEQWKNMNFGMDVTTPAFGPNDWAYWQTLMDGDLPTYTGEMSENTYGQQMQQ